MAGKDIIMASQRELRRLHVVHKVLEGSVRQREAGDAFIEHPADEEDCAACARGRASGGSAPF
jgi:hypothetical protein